MRQVVNGGFEPIQPFFRYGYRATDAAIERTPGLKSEMPLQRRNGNPFGLESGAEVHTFRHGVRIRSPEGMRKSGERIFPGPMMPT